jgi:5'-methylthioadenosine phosphorylase
MVSMPAGNIAIIGGTGFEQMPPEIYAEPMTIKTRFGVSQVLSVSNNYVEPHKLYFLSRHGDAHGLAPHQINYRANTAALVELGVSYAYATNAVGSLHLDLPPGSLVLIDDFLDYTRARPLSYFTDGDMWQHIDFSEPYSSRMRRAALISATRLGISLVERGTYLCCDGPRFESPAEVRLFASWGADVVGMTGIPEVIFAHEAGIEYAAIAIVTNFGAGLTSQRIDHSEVVTSMRGSINAVRELLLGASGIVIEEIEGA